MIIQSADEAPTAQNVNTTAADTVTMTNHATEQMAFVIQGVSLDTQEENVTKVPFLYIVHVHYTSFTLSL